MISVVILCGGSSSRMQSDVNKVLLPLEDKPLFMYSLEKFTEFSSDIVVVSNSNDYNTIKEIYPNVVLGGETRQDSVYNGVINTKYDKVLIHDGARPFVTREDIKNIIEASNECSLAFLGNYLVDSINKIKEDVDTFSKIYTVDNVFNGRLKKRINSFTTYCITYLGWSTNSTYNIYVSFSFSSAKYPVNVKVSFIKS